MRHGPGFAVAVCAVLVTAAAPARAFEFTAPDTTPLGIIQSQAKRLHAEVRTPLAKAFLDAASTLAHIAPRTIHYDSSRTHYWWPEDAAAVPESARAKTVTRTLDEQFYYNTRYGTPIAYVRAFEILGEAGLRDLRGARVADYGYGTIGHLRMLAALGADVRGIEVDPLLERFYSKPGDQGPVPGITGRDGSVTLIHGSFPGDTSVARQVGSGLRLFISKNTLKRGYIHPAEKVNPRMLVHLGVDDSTYVAHLARIVEPGGFVMIYNLSPAPSPPGQPYKPWADGRSPFPRETYERSGFEVLAFDADDSKAARAMGRALEWDQPPSKMDLENDLFAHYTLLKRNPR